MGQSEKGLAREVYELVGCVCWLNLLAVLVSCRHPSLSLPQAAGFLVRLSRLEMLGGFQSAFHA